MQSDRGQSQITIMITDQLACPTLPPSLLICVPDMPKQANGQPIYNKADADRAWGKLMALYKAGLA